MYGKDTNQQYTHRKAIIRMITLYKQHLEIFWTPENISIKITKQITTATRHY